MQLRLCYNTDTDDGKVLGTCFSLYFRPGIVFVQYDENSECYRKGLQESILEDYFFLFVKSFSPLIIYQRMPQNNKERENLVSKTRGNKIGIYCSTRVAFFKL